MCVIALKPRNVGIPKSVLKECFRNNPHGAGFAYPLNGKVILEKGFFSFKDFWSKYKDIDPRYPVLIHFRVATSGEIDKNNCHPWRIDDSHVFAHNGILQNRLGVASDECSDTGIFSKHVIKPIFSINNTTWTSAAFKWLMEGGIGKNNKIVILNKSGEYVIFNEKEGEWAHGVWFSNQSYKTSRKTMASPSDSYLAKDEEGNIVNVIVKNGESKYTKVDFPLALPPGITCELKKITDPKSVPESIKKQLDNIKTDLSKEVIDISNLY